MWPKGHVVAAGTGLRSSPRSWGTSERGRASVTPSASSVMEWPGLAWGGGSLDSCVLLGNETAGGTPCSGAGLSPGKPGGLEQEWLLEVESL